MRRYMVCLYSVMALPPMLQWTSCQELRPAAVQQVALRYDDFSTLSDTSFETKLFQLAKDHHVCIAVAAIPAITPWSCHQPGNAPGTALTDAKIAMLKDGIAAGTIEVAQHGLSHQTWKVGPPYSEFAGLPYDMQRDRIAMGKEMLEDAVGIKIQMFIPPWNSYDDTTLQALEDLEFTRISAGPHEPMLSDSKLVYVPCTAGIPKIHDLAAMLDKSKNKQKRTPIVMLFHSYQFIDSVGGSKGYTLAQLDNVLTWLEGRSDVQIMPLSKIDGVTVAGE